MNENISAFLQEQTCATVSCIGEKGHPYCFTCFYVFNSEDGLIYFKSSSDSLHSSYLKKNPVVAGTILPDKFNKLQIRGIQLEGVLLENNHPLARSASGHYHKKNPLALAMPGEIWTIQINRIKFTDSKMGFGKKLTWIRSGQEKTVGIDA